MTQSDSLDERTIEVIVTRVVGALRDELAEIAAGLGQTRAADLVLTVDDVAERLDVSRSTVYAHWREWGGYKLGAGEKAAIRFSASALPSHSATTPLPPPNGAGPATATRRPRTRRRSVLRGVPRLPVELGDEG